jgi:hypothetical protein
MAEVSATDAAQAGGGVTGGLQPEENKFQKAISAWRSIFIVAAHWAIADSSQVSISLLSCPQSTAPPPI